MANIVSIDGNPIVLGTSGIEDGSVTLAKLNADVIESLPSPTDAQVDSAVSDWLGLHPEATTTVQDNSVTNAKLVQTGGILSTVYNENIDAGERRAEYYGGSVGETITTSSGSSSSGYIIDLSSYVGKYVRVNFTSTATSSSRLTAICDASGTIYASIQERYMTTAGFLVYVTNTQNKLYVSFTRNATTDFTVTCLSGLVGQIDLIKLGLTDTMYVSETGSDTNGGTSNAPFATIQKALDTGAPVVKVAPGSYGAISVNGRIIPLEIVPWLPDTSDTTIAEQMIVITGSTSGNLVYVNNCDNLTMRNVYANADNKAVVPFNIRNVRSFTLERCKASDVGGTSYQGFTVVNASGELRECVAWNIPVDGFNFHGYGNTVLIDCVAHDCGDDGVSHHNQCTGTVIGGEFYRCGKGGVSTPTHGAMVNVYGSYSHDNTRYGLYVASDASVATPSRGLVCGCAFVDNGTADIYVTNSTVVGWGNRFDTSTVGADGTFTNLDA